MAARISERDLVNPAMRAAAAAPGGEIATTKLIAILEDEFAPEGHDAEIIDGRRDTYFSQKVRNLISHRATGTSMFALGYADYDASSESIKITDAGRRFLGQVPDE